VFGPPGWGLDARLTTLLCKRIIVAKSKEVKTGSYLSESFKKGYGSNSAVLPMMLLLTMMMMCSVKWMI
jgi:hypothetical protein